MFIVVAKETLPDDTQKGMQEVRLKERTQTQMCCMKHDDLIPSEVRHRTAGFRDLPALLSYAMVLCDGNVELRLQTNSKLTWLEEWLFYFEMKYGGRTLYGWQDLERMYKCTQKPLRRVFNKMVSLLELTTRDRWPMYDCYDEDAKFWDQNGMNNLIQRITGKELSCCIMQLVFLGRRQESNANHQRAIFSDH